METVIETLQGPAKAHLHPAERPRGGLVLGHGAGGGIGALDLVAVTEAARAGGWTVALVEQPYRVAGRRSPPPAPRLDAAWIEIVESLAAGALAGLPLVVGGRSSGARVACRTAAATGAIGVLCLAFPLQPPARRSGAAAPDRLPELNAVDVPVLVVQGTSDPFGMPPESATRTVVRVAGNHGLKADLPAVASAVSGWLSRVIGA